MTVDLTPERAGQRAFRAGDASRLVRVFAEFLSPAHKRKLAWVGAWATVSAFLQLLVAVIITPYTKCLTGNCPDSAWLGGSGSYVLAKFSAVMAVVFVLQGVSLVALTILGTRLVQQVQTDTVSRLLNGYLHLSWPDFRSHNTAHYFRRCATTAVDAAFVVQQVIQMITSALVLTLLVGLVLLQYPLIALVLAGGIALVTGVMQRLLSARIRNAGHEREAALQVWSVGMSEAFGAFKEIRVFGREDYFLEHLDRGVRDVAKANVKLNVLPMLPRLALELVLMISLLSVASIWFALGKNLGQLLPVIVFFAVIVRTCLPALMNILSIRALLAGSIVNLELVLAEYRAAIATVPEVSVACEPGPPRLWFDNVTFRHAPGETPVLDGLSFELPAGTWTALIGQSGAGKSTVMELLCGLLKPTEGRVGHAWEPAPTAPRVAYLPQHVAVLDGSIEENVVFGNGPVDHARVADALRTACLSARVANIPGGANAHVGANGISLSGGERQRLAIARAIYQRPDVLLLDEATSGLDADTEQELLGNLKRSVPGLTVVLISHRKQTLAFVDRIFEVADRGIEELPTLVETI